MSAAAAGGATVARDAGAAHLAVIDMQTAFRRAGQWHVPRYDAAAERIGALVESFGAPIVTRFVPDPAEAGAWSAYYDRWDEMRLPPSDPIWDVELPGGPLLDVAGDGNVGTSTIDLPTFGKWGPGLAGRVPVGEELILTGVATDCCVLATALAAADAGRFVTVVTDACAGQSDEAHDGALAMMDLLAPMIRLTTCEELLADVGPVRAPR